MPETSTSQPMNLTSAASTMRKVIKFGAIFLVFLMVGRVALTSFIAFWKAANPPPPPPPSVGFGPLPKIIFPNQTSKPTSYRLETVGGTTPFITDRANVYFMPSVQANIRALERANQKAVLLGYQFEPEAIDSRRYRWTNTTPIVSTLEMDILTGTFSITTNWASYPTLLTNTRLASKEDSINQVKNLVIQAGAVSTDFKTASASAKYLKAIGGQYQEVSVAIDADFVQVDLFRPAVNPKYSSVTSKGKEGPVHAVITPTGTILEMKMHLFPIETQPAEDYPLRSTAEAWQLLSNGEGYVAQKGELDTAIVRSIYMSYYEPDTEQPYYQPVYVFEGDKGFVGIVEAVDARCIQPNLCQIPATQ